MPNKKKVIISAINFFEGGPLSVLKDCLTCINSSEYTADYQFVALVNTVDLFEINEFENIQFIAYPKSRKSYLYRLYYEYIYFKKKAVEWDVFFWLSLHDITPNLKNVNQAVYCHNPSPFNTINYKDIYIQPTQFFFRLFYKYLYKINIKKNKFVVVQQFWIKDEFVKMFQLNRNKVIVAPPQIPQIPQKYFFDIKGDNESKKIFFFPTFPRTFKNIEIIGEAVKMLNDKGMNNFMVWVTVDGSENKYSRHIFNKFRNVPNINFVGLLDRNRIYETYALSHCLIFPSKLETWGLPISEFKQFNKPILVANLAYAKETVGDYDKVRFFDVDKPNQLAKLMIDFLEGTHSYDSTSSKDFEEPFVLGWNELFSKFLS